MFHHILIGVGYCMGYSNKNVIAKLVKSYILQNPGATLREVSNFLEDNDFGINISCTPYKLYGIIVEFNEENYRWFDIEKKDCNPCKFYCKKNIKGRT